MQQMKECPKCGKPESSHDGESYCGTCETEYQKEEAFWQDRAEEGRAAKAATHSDDCECVICMPPSYPAGW